MNQRPTRAPPPPDDQQTAVQERTSDFVAAQPVTQLPARTDPHQIETADTVSARVEAPEEELPATGPGAVIAAIAAVMAEIKPIEKSGWNDFHKYWHVRMQDLSRELTPLMGKHGIVIWQTEEGRELFDKGNAVAVRYRFTVAHKSGAIWPQRPLQTGVSACRNRGGFDDKALNKCHTAARKYFLISLFQLPSEDSEDADADGPQADGNQRQRPQGPQARRPAPSPSGKLPPHLLPVIDGEAPETWAKRFTDFINKAESTAEIDKWYDLNVVVFDKLKRGAFFAVYDGLTDAMDTRVAKLDSKPDGSPRDLKLPNDDTFPADRPADDLEIPAALRRTAPKPAADDINDGDRDWLMSLEEAFKECGDLETLSEEQRSRMAPSKDHVSGTVWNKAMDILNKRIEEING